MGAGGSHPQATMMPDPWARSCRPSEGQTMVKAPPETITRVDSSRRPFAPAGGFRGARIRSTTRAPLNTRAHDNAALLEETLRLFVEATDKDEASMRQQLVNKRPAELLRDRELWKTRVEEKQRFQAKKKEAWEFFRRMPSLKPKNQEELEEEFKRRVMTGYSSGSTEGREKYLDEWKIALQKKALEGQRTGEDGRRRFQLQETHGVGENFRPIPVPENSVLSCDVGHDVVSSVGTTLSNQIFSSQPGFLSKSPRESVRRPRKTVCLGSSISMRSHQCHVTRLKLISLSTLTRTGS